MQSATTPTATPSPAPGGGQTLASVLPEWLLFPGWRWVLAALIVAVGVLVSRYVVRLVGRPVARRFQRQSVAQMALRLVRLGVVLVTLGIAASVLGLEFGDLVLSVTVFSAVLGIVLAPIVGSTINGLFLLADQPYEIGDMIELDDGRRGFVDDITIRYTKMFTLNNTFLVIPNSEIREHLVTNYSAEDERVRLSLDVVVTYESDVDAARRLLSRAAAADEAVIEGGPDIRIGSARYPARPTVLKSDFGDDGVALTLRYWAKTPYKIPSVESRVRTRIWDAFAETDADIEFAYPHRHLVFDDTSGTLDATVGSRDGDRARSDDGSIQTAFGGRSDDVVEDSGVERAADLDADSGDAERAAGPGADGGHTADPDADDGDDDPRPRRPDEG
ncbi:mechanosensitive ion channel family protein [Halobellus limi]|uniref:Mechanosensitive ion channel family protein n=1 Tax=Halobellus limi TaxID=699433 RepID=A0A1H5U7N1_9EURY|nr:mechanosensitive ion channel family protein [Halobellus limi]QCC47134.1 mechanosensitive ion channel family protein [Halobellus limi]SEF70351.1 Small-conductance mechanosensitive channel [Halobellus limi]